MRYDHLQFAPEVASVPSSQLRRWHLALDYMGQRGAFSGSSDAPEMNNRGKGGPDGERGAGTNREKRRSELLRVLMICEANIFGQGEEEGEEEKLSGY